MATTSETNIQQIVDDYKANLPRTKITNLATGAAEKIFGKDIAKVAGWMPNLIGGVLDKFFKMPSAWSRLSGQDKENLITSLAQEQVWIKNLTEPLTIRAIILATLQANKIIDKDQKNTFYQKNPWALTKIDAQINAYKEQLQIANDIVSFTGAVVQTYDVAKMRYTALSAMQKVKNGQGITDAEKEAIRNYLELQKNISVSISIRKNQDIKKG